MLNDVNRETFNAGDALRIIRQPQLAKLLLVRLTFSAYSGTAPRGK